MISEGVYEAWISLKYNYSSDDLYWLTDDLYWLTDGTAFVFNASKYYMSNIQLQSHNCITDCDPLHGPSSFILQQDGTWKGVDESYVAKAYVCMDLNEVSDDIEVVDFLVDGVPEALDFEILNLEGPVSWNIAPIMCAHTLGYQILAPVATHDLQRKVRVNI